jgi:hypothetical protein
MHLGYHEGREGESVLREAAMACELPEELQQDEACVAGGVGSFDAVVQVHLDLSPAFVTVIGQEADDGRVVLLGWVEVGVTQGPALVVTPRSHGTWIVRVPRPEASLLLCRIRVPCWACVGHDGRLEVIGYGEDDVLRAIGGRPTDGPLSARGDEPR